MDVKRDLARAQGSRGRAKDKTDPIAVKIIEALLGVHGCSRAQADGEPRLYEASHRFVRERSGFHRGQV